jgi:hypothetical protein
MTNSVKPKLIKIENQSIIWTMITLKHLEIYKKYKGNIDGWLKHNDSDESIATEIWTKIRGFIENQIVIKGGLASEVFENQTMQSMHYECENKEVVDAIINMPKFPSSNYSFAYIYEGRSRKAFANEYYFDGKTLYRITTEGIYCEITTAGVPGPANMTIWIQSGKPGEMIQPHGLVQALGEGIEYAQMH